MNLIEILLEEEDFDPNQEQGFNLETYGQLKLLLNAIAKGQKKGFILSKGKEIAIDIVLGAIPGAQAAKKGYDLFKGLINRPDNKKTDTWLDKLDVDDEMAAIVDDKVENGFFQFQFDTVSNKNNDEELPPGFNMNDELAKYLEKEYKQRTVTGY
jgi:hypothetical protein